MTLDEAIKHAEEVATKQENNAKGYPRPNKSVKGSGRKYNAYLKCAEEHRQLAEWLKDYKRLLEQEPICETLTSGYVQEIKAECDDCVSRQAVLDQTYLWSKDEFLRVTNPFDYLRKRINSLLPVTPAEKVGWWVIVNERAGVYRCSVCNELSCCSSFYCPDCGARMEESWNG